TYPIRSLERITNRQKGQKHNGEPTRIEWTSDKIVLPTIAGSRASGLVISSSGMKGSDIRGQNHARPDGQVVRPQLVLVDDPQTFRNGEVTLAARPVDGERVEIVVSDNGMGLSEDELAEVRRFVPGGTSKKTYGTGFGLPIAKRKIEDHGGLLGVESEVNKGTVVTITLPVEAAGDGG
ncbi:MAG: ATP-binding protein, partial [Phycisphaerae bacterium]